MYIEGWLQFKSRQCHSLKIRNVSGYNSSKYSLQDCENVTRYSEYKGKS